MRGRWIGGLGLILVLSLFFNQSLTHAFGVYGPQPVDPYQDEKYYYWGSDLEPQYVSNGINIAVDGTSVSYQSIKATVTMDAGLINDRDISYFAILANGVYVDFFYPYFDNALTPPRFLEYYTLDMDISNVFIGSEVYFQILAVHQNPEFDPVTQEPDGAQYVVGWSAQSANYLFKPLPVIDRGAIGVLNAILSKLEELKNALEGKLDSLTQAVEKIYKASPEAQERLDASVEGFMDALPMKQLEDQAEALQDKLEEKRQALKNPTENPEELKFFQFEWVYHQDDSVMVPLLDLSEYPTTVTLIRKFIQMCLWAWFFHMLFAMLSPRLGM